MKIKSVKNITLEDGVIVLGFFLIVIGLGIKMAVIRKETKDKEMVKIEKTNKTVEIIVNINFASAMELEVLPAIGPVTAQKIIDYRSSRGAFKSKEQIMEVSGIGSKTYEKIKDKIKI